MQSTGERALTPEDARRIGDLLRISGASDVIDAHVAVMAHDGDTIMSSYGHDLEVLLDSAGSRVGLVEV